MCRPKFRETGSSYVVECTDFFKNLRRNDFQQHLTAFLIVNYCCKHCTKNEEILNGKLHFLCSKNFLS